MIRNFERRLEAVNRILHSGKSGLRVCFADGTAVTVPAGKAIDLVKERATAIDRVEDTGQNGMLADLLTGLCAGGGAE